MPNLKPLLAVEFGDFHERCEPHHSDLLAITQLLPSYHLLRKHRDVLKLPMARPVATLSWLPEAGSSHQSVKQRAENIDCLKRLLDDLIAEQSWRRLGGV